MKYLKGALGGFLFALSWGAISSCGVAKAPPPAPAWAASSTPSGTGTPLRASGVSERRVQVQGQTRSYLIYIPEGLDPSRPAAVLFAFHGFAEDGQQALSYTGFDDLAETERFIAIYPNGTGLSTRDLSWDSGSCCGYAAIERVDESAFVRAILTDLSTLAKVDPRRIYVAGFANGGMLSYRLGCDMPDVFAAMASVDGDLSYYGACQPKQPVSLIHIHGLADKVIPYAGTSLPGFGEQYPPVSYGIATWAELDGCATPARISREGSVTLTVYSGCRFGSGVELYAIQGLGHAWPTGSLGGGISSRTIWDFFAQHPKI